MEIMPVVVKNNKNFTALKSNKEISRENKAPCTKNDENGKGYSVA